MTEPDWTEKVPDIETGPGRASGPAAKEERPPPVVRLRNVPVILRDATAGLFRHDGQMVASAIAFSLVFALFPFAIFVVALGAMIGGADLAAYVRDEAVAMLPEHVVETLDPELRRVLVFTDRARPLAIGLAVTLVSITGAVESIRHGLNRAYGCTEDRPMLRRYLSSLLFVLAVTAFLLVVAALGIAVPVVLSVLHRYVPETPLDRPLLGFAREGFLVVATAGMLFALHLFLPARHGRVTGVIAGVALTLVAWWVSARLFGFYVSEIANYSATYAGLAGFVMLMFFLYVQALIFLYGAEINRSIADYRGQPLTN